MRRIKHWRMLSTHPMGWNAHLRRLLHLWEAAQVEFHGQYSPHRLIRFAQFYETTSRLRIFLVLLLTPLPCLATVISFDVVPLASPEQGYADNNVFWLRMLGLYEITTVAVITLYHRILHLPPMSYRHLGAAVILISVGATAGSYGMAALIGFPVPFLAIMSAPVWTILTIAVVAAMWMPYFRRDPTLWSTVIDYSKILCLQGTMTVIYPVYYFMFRRLSFVPQAAFSLLLPSIKVVIKNLMSRFFRFNSDLRPEEVVLSIEIFSSLFITFCMQNSNSILPMVFLTLIDFVHACASIHDIKLLANGLLVTHSRISRLASKASLVVPLHAPVPSSSSSLDNILRGVCTLASQMSVPRTERVSEAAQRSVNRKFRVYPLGVLQSRSSSTGGSFFVKLRAPTVHDVHSINPKSLHVASPNIRRQSFIGRKPSMNVRRQSGTTSTRLSHISQHEDLLVLQMLRFLHATEYIVLVEFIEVVIPTIYGKCSVHFLTSVFWRLNNVTTCQQSMCL